MFSICYVTVPTMEVATAIAQHLVKGRTAACVNIIPEITSVYSWEGKIEQDKELLLMIKTRTELVPQLIEEVKAKHPYDVPEVISVGMGEGHSDYLNWVKANTEMRSPGTAKPEEKNK